MTQPRIQIGSSVTIAASMFFNGQARTGTVVDRQGDKVCIDISGGNRWSGPWHVSQLSEGE
jgi:hypothetical protein